MDVDEEKRRGRGAEQSLEGRGSFKENIETKACLPARYPVILSKERVDFGKSPMLGRCSRQLGRTRHATCQR